MKPNPTAALGAFQRPFRLSPAGSQRAELLSLLEDNSLLNLTSYKSNQCTPKRSGG